MFDFKGDISDKGTLEKFVNKVIADCGHVDYLINTCMHRRWELQHRST